MELGVDTAWSSIKGQGLGAALPTRGSSAVVVNPSLEKTMVGPRRATQDKAHRSALPVAPGQADSLIFMG